MRTMIVGMGNMGRALADALLAQQLPVTVWNRTPNKCQPAIDAGAVRADTILEGAASSDVLITCLADSQSVHETVITGDMAKALNGKIFIQLSQALPAQSLVFGQWASGNRIGYLEGSIMGYPSQIRAKDCMIVYSGDPATFNACHVVLNALGAKPRLVGNKPGVATAFDKAFFSALYAHLVGLIHGAAICKAAGAPLDTYFELMVGSWDWAVPDSSCAKMIASGRYSPVEAKLETHAYAYDQVAPLCQKIGVDASLPMVISNILRVGIENGHGADEIASLMEVFNIQKT